jgi:hypothetical protein
MARTIRTSHAKNSTIPGMAYPLMVLVLAMMASYPPMPDLIDGLTEAYGFATRRPASANAMEGDPLGASRRETEQRTSADCWQWLTRPPGGSVANGSTPAEVSMSRMKRNKQAETAANGARDRARQAAARVRPLASSTRAAARRRAHKTRAWAAPQTERMAEVLQDSVAPKVSALLSSAAQRLEPAKPRRRPWRKLAVITVLAAVASAAAALVLNRRKPGLTTSAAESDADELTPAAHARDGQARTSGPVRSS